MALRLRRTLLFTPGTRADRWSSALAGPADVIMADLEDSVAPADKALARKAVAKAVQESKPGKVERGVRINPWPGELAQRDIDAIASLQPDAIMLPKVETADDVRTIDRYLTDMGCRSALIVQVETAKGVLHAESIAASCPRIVAIVFGAEDYAASVGARRTAEGLEVLYARSHVVAAAATAGLDAIDQVFVALEDLDGLEKDSRLGARLGYRGKQVIHPKQAEVVHRALRPTHEEILWARRVKEAADHAGIGAGGVALIDGRMVDRPLVVQAERILALAAQDRGS